MNTKKLNRIEYVKIFSRVSKQDYQRLAAIRKKYGFKSNYEIVQYLMHCFLRVADPDNDTQIEPVPYEIEQMFDNMAQAEKHLEYVKPKRRCRHTTPDNP